VYHALYLDNMTEYHLREKLACLYDILPTQILELYLQGPSGIHILVTDHVSILDFIRLIFASSVHCMRCCVTLSSFMLSVNSVKHLLNEIASVGQQDFFKKLPTFIKSGECVHLVTRTID